MIIHSLSEINYKNQNNLNLKNSIKINYFFEGLTLFQKRILILFHKIPKFNSYLKIINNKQYIKWNKLRVQYQKKSENK